MVHDSRHRSHLEGLELFSDFVVLFLDADLGKEPVHELVCLPGTEPTIDLIDGDLSKAAVGSLEGDLLLGLVADLDDGAVGEAGEALRRGGTGLLGQEAKEDDAEDGATHGMMLARIGRGVDVRCPKRAVAAGIYFSFGTKLFPADTGTRDAHLPPAGRRQQDVSFHSAGSLLHDILNVRPSAKSPYVKRGLLCREDQPLRGRADRLPARGSRLRRCSSVAYVHTPLPCALLSIPTVSAFSRNHFWQMV